MNPQSPSDRELDVRGLTCPEPVLRTRQALDALPAGAVTVLTDRPESRDNIIRFAERAGCHVTVTERAPGTFAVKLEKAVGVDKAEPRAGTVVVLTRDWIGAGADDLGRLLAGLLLRTFAESPLKPACLVLMNGGVRLALADSEVLPSLRALEAQGVTIRVCGTCLDFFGVKDQLKTGTISNIYEAAETMLSAQRVITF